MDTLNKLSGGYDDLQYKELSKLMSKTPQPKRKFSEDVEKKIEPMRSKSNWPYFIGVYL